MRTDRLPPRRIAPSLREGLVRADRAAPAGSRARAVALGPLIATLMLGGCDWVDATGAQEGDGPIPVPVALDDLAPGVAQPLLETRALRLGVSGEPGDGAVYTWSEEPLESGALDSCLVVDGFRPELAASSLEEACTDAEDCDFAFERDAEADGNAEAGIGFIVTAPVLRASVGLRHELSVRTADGSSGARAFDFCLIAMNEAPDPGDDGPYEVVEGTTLSIGGPGSPGNLLENDEDDDDVGNRGLTVDTTPAEAPSASSAFALGSDGSFSYAFEERGLRAGFTDSFDYWVTDGVTDRRRAKVTLTIVPSDLPPRLDELLEPVDAIVGTPLDVDLGAGFGDPEGGTLTFTLAGEGSLPASGSLSLTPGGRLTGEPLEVDVGVYDVRFVVSDGVRETPGQVTLTVELPPNRAPVFVAGSSDNITLTRLFFIRGTLADFTDPDGDPLTYALIGDLPPGLAFDPEDGVVSGRPRRRGLYDGIQVEAIDPAGATARSIVFAIEVL